MGDKQYGIDNEMVRKYAEDIKAVHDKGLEIAIVIGGAIFSEVLALRNQVWIVHKLIIWECLPQ